MKRLLLLVVVIAAALMLGGFHQWNAKASISGNCTTAKTFVLSLSWGSDTGDWIAAWQQNCNSGSDVEISIGRHLPSDCTGCYPTIHGPITYTTGWPGENNVTVFKQDFTHQGCNDNANYRARLRFIDRNYNIQNDYFYTGVNFCT